MAKTHEGWTLRQEYIRCGKKGCNRCPHGPYWYGYRSKGNAQEKKYFGKRDPRPGASEPGPKRQSEDEKLPPCWELIFGKHTRDAQIARTILGLGQSAITKISLGKAYRRMTLECHPDRGGSPRRMAAVNCAFEYLQSLVK